MSKTEQSEKAPAVRVISVKTAKALKQKDGEPSLQYLLTRLHSLGFVATAAIPVRLHEGDDEDEFIVTSFLLVMTQMLEPDTIDAEPEEAKKSAKKKPVKKKPAKKKPVKKPQGLENIGTKKHPPVSE